MFNYFVDVVYEDGNVLRDVIKARTWYGAVDYANWWIDSELEIIEIKFLNVEKNECFFILYRPDEKTGTEQFTWVNGVSLYCERE